MHRFALGETGMAKKEDVYNHRDHENEKICRSVQTLKSIMEPEINAQHINKTRICSQVIR